MPAYKENLYPNLYTIIIGPPGVGKTVITKLTQKLWKSLPDHYTSSSSLSRASLMDELHDAARKLVMPTQIPAIISFNSLLITSNELSVLLPAFDPDFMGHLTDIYDGIFYSERKRTAELQYKIEHPQINLLAATTPSYLNSIMPEGAWDQGFISRVIMAFSGEHIIADLFTVELPDNSKYDDLVHDLKIISTLYGKMVFTEEAAKAFQAWHRIKGPPRPDHPKLQHYVTRRSAHIIKLCQIACASRGDDLIINMDDYQRALDWLLEAEQMMPDIFKSFAIGGDARAMEDLYYYAIKMSYRTKKDVPEAALLEFLAARVPAHSVERVLQLMVKQGIFTKYLDAYKPRPMKDV